MTREQEIRIEKLLNEEDRLRDRIAEQDAEQAKLRELLYLIAPRCQKCNGIATQHGAGQWSCDDHMADLGEDKRHGGLTVFWTPYEPGYQIKALWTTR